MSAQRAFIASALLCLCAARMPCLSAELPDIGTSGPVLELPATASETEFRKRLGEPVGVIRMSLGRVGLLYRQNLMLIFQNGNLREARTWQLPSLSPELYHGWLSYVTPSAAVRGYTVDKIFRIGMTRAEVERHLASADTDSDEFSLVAKRGAARIWFGFEYEVTRLGDRRSVRDQILISLAVVFPDPEP
jgi:hypothetical protein